MHKSREAEGAGPYVRRAFARIAKRIGRKMDQSSLGYNSIIPSARSREDFNMPATDTAMNQNEDFAWTPQPLAAAWVVRVIDALATRNSVIGKLAFEL